MTDDERAEGASAAERLALSFHTFRDFIEQYSERISREGMFVETDEPLDVGSRVEFEVSLSDEFRLLHGAGEVVWRIDPGTSADWTPGMAVRFDDLDEPSRRLIDRVVDKHTKDGGEPFSLVRWPAGPPAESEAAPPPASATTTAPTPSEAPAAAAPPAASAPPPPPEAPAPATPADPAEATPPGEPADSATPPSGAAEADAVVPLDSETPAPAADDARTQLSQQTEIIVQGAADWLKSPETPPEEPESASPAPEPEPAEPVATGEPVAPQAAAPDETESLLADSLTAFDDSLFELAPGTLDPKPEDGAETEAAEAREAPPASSPPPPEPRPAATPAGEATEAPAPPPVEPQTPAPPTSKTPAEAPPSPPEPEPPAPSPEAPASVPAAAPPAAAPESPAMPTPPTPPTPEDATSPAEPSTADPAPAAAPATADAAFPDTGDAGAPTAVPPTSPPVVAPPAAPTDAATPLAAATDEVADEAPRAPTSIAGAGKVREPRRFAPWLILLLLIAVAASAYLNRERLSEIWRARGAEAPAGPVAAPPPAAPSVAEGAGASPDEATPPGDAGAAEDGAASAQDAVDPAAGTPQTAPGEPTSTPAATAATPPADSPAARDAPETAAPAETPASGPVPRQSPAPPSIPAFTAVDRVTTLARDGETLVVIETNGSIRNDAFDVVRVSGGSPRQVVKLFGIDRPLDPAVTPVGTSEVVRLRAGLHSGRGGGELHLVADLTGPEVRVTGVEVRDSALVVRFGRP